MTSEEIDQKVRTIVGDNGGYPRINREENTIEFILKYGNDNHSFMGCRYEGLSFKDIRFWTGSQRDIENMVFPATFAVMGTPKPATKQEKLDFIKSYN